MSINELAEITGKSKEDLMKILNNKDIIEIDLTEAN